MDDPVAANRLADRLIAAALSLGDFPPRGREVRKGVHQLSVVYPYLIRYRLVGETVEILSVRHGARSDLG